MQGKYWQVTFQLLLDSLQKMDDDDAVFNEDTLIGALAKTRLRQLSSYGPLRMGGPAQGYQKCSTSFDADPSAAIAGFSPSGVPSLDDRLRPAHSVDATVASEAAANDAWMNSADWERG